ncbi:(2Fe-2S)-binding protein [Georgenia sp. Z1491]|uniref:(2Fe-2S)-binding protein n=1 Tax=Georgenia sp. Z1491 TaxID=3416707 RepID=UPI003CECD0A1
MRINGAIEIDETRLAPGLRLLDLLREQLGLTGTKEGCGRGECGACTVLVDGRPVNSCILLARRVRGEVETVEGLADESSVLRTCFARRAAFQCGFCTPGQIVTGTALLREGLPADSHELRHRMSGNICRCTGYEGIIGALRDAENGAGADESVPHADRTWREDR